MNFDLFFNILRKCLVGTILVTFALVFVYIPQQYDHVPEVEAAGWPVFDAVGNSLLAIQTGIETSLAAKEYSLDMIAFTIGKAIVSSLIGSLIKWINSGFKGKPAFVRDFKRFLLDAADKGVGEFIKSLGGIGSFICSPFKLDIQIALALKYQQAREHEEDPEECRLTDIVNNIEDLYNSSFSKASLEDFITITSNPTKYTPYGQILTAGSSMRVRIANAKGQVLTETNWSGGFLSGKICEMVPGSTRKKEKCTISKPGKIIQEALSFNLDTGRQSLVEADEINELITALISQLANQAIIGAAGLLGLSAGTGYTDSDYGASYIDSAVDEANNQVSSTTYSNISLSAATFEESLQVQADAQNAANSAIAELLPYINNQSNPADKREAAQESANDASAVRAKAIANVPRIIEIQNEYLALKEEFDATDTTDARKQQIAQRLATLQTNFTQLAAITRSELNNHIGNWQIPS